MAETKNKQFRKVKYRQHGVLSKNFDFKTDKTSWVFETFDLTRDYEDFELIAVFDDLSMDGFELVCGSEDEYILRTKEDIEEKQEYYEI